MAKMLAYGWNHRLRGGPPRRKPQAAQALTTQWEAPAVQWEMPAMQWEGPTVQREISSPRCNPRHHGGRLALVSLLLAVAAACAFGLAGLLNGLPLRAQAGGGAAWAEAPGAGPKAVAYQPGAPVEVLPVPPTGEEATAAGAMAPVLQNPELTNGCEATALATVLQAYGHPADKCDLAYRYIPRQDLAGKGESRQGPDPANAYAGDPATRTGFYCFAAPLAEGANLYLEENGATLRAVDFSGAEQAAIDAELAAGRPVILWVTLDYSPEPRYLESSRWTLPDGTLYTPYANLHCVALAAQWDGLYRVCDPMQGEQWVEAEQLYQSYLALGAHAVAFTE